MKKVVWVATKGNTGIDKVDSVQEKVYGVGIKKIFFRYYFCFGIRFHCLKKPTRIQVLYGRGQLA